MHRIDDETASLTLPPPSPPGPVPGGFFKQKEPGVEGTTASHDWLNSCQEEVCGVIEGVNTTLSKTVRTQLFDAIQLMVDEGPNDSGLLRVKGDPNPTLGNDLDLKGFAISASSNSTNDSLEFVAGTYIGPPSGGAIYIKSIISRIGQPSNRIKFDTNAIKIYGPAIGGGGAEPLIADITTAGLRLNNANARVNTILDESDLASNSSTAVPTQASVKTYTDAAASQLGQILMTCAGNYNGNLPMVGWGTQSSFGPADTAPFQPSYYNGWVAPRSGVIKKVYVRIKRTVHNGLGNACTYTFRILKNYTTIGLTITDTRVGTLDEVIILSDLVTNLSVSAGDKISAFVYVQTSSGSDTYVGAATMLFE